MISRKLEAERILPLLFLVLTTGHVADAHYVMLICYTVLNLFVKEFLLHMEKSCIM